MTLPLLLFSYSSIIYLSSIPNIPKLDLLTTNIIVNSEKLFETTMEVSAKFNGVILQVRERYIKP